MWGQCCQQSPAIPRPHLQPCHHVLHAVLGGHIDGEGGVRGVRGGSRWGQPLCHLLRRPHVPVGHGHAGAVPCQTVTHGAADATATAWGGGERGVGVPEVAAWGVVTPRVSPQPPRCHLWGRHHLPDVTYRDVTPPRWHLWGLSPPKMSPIGMSPHPHPPEVTYSICYPTGGTYGALSPPECHLWGDVTSPRCHLWGLSPRRSVGVFSPHLSPMRTVTPPSCHLWVLSPPMCPL